jgi:hypothetical protein
MYTEINRFKNINSYINSGLYKTASTYASMSENDRRDAKKRVNQTRLKNKNVSVENSDKIYHASSNKIEEFKLIPHYLAEDKGVVFGTPSKVTALTFASPWKDSDLDHYSINDGPLTLKEKYEGALEKVYKGKKGYLYELDPKPFIWNPSLMRSERVSYTVPKILGVREIPDVYEELLEEQRMNNLKLIKYNKPVREKIAGLLTQRGRNQIKSGNFALPGGRYPIHDISHARNALARVAQHGTQSEQSAVKSAVKSRYPSIIIGSEKTAGKGGGKAAKSVVNAITNTQKAETQSVSKAVEKLEKQKAKLEAAQSDTEIAKAQKKIQKHQKRIDDAQPSNNTSATIPEKKILSFDELMQEIRARHPEFLAEKPTTNIVPQRTQTQVPRSSTATPTATATMDQPIQKPSNTSQLNAAQRNALDAFGVTPEQRDVLAGQMKKMPKVAPIFSPNSMPHVPPESTTARNYWMNLAKNRPNLFSLDLATPPNMQVNPKTVVPSLPPNTQVNPKTVVPSLPPNTQVNPKTVVPQPQPAIQPNTQNFNSAATQRLPSTQSNDPYAAFRMGKTELANARMNTTDFRAADALRNIKPQPISQPLPNTQVKPKTVVPQPPSNTQATPPSPYSMLTMPTDLTENIRAFNAAQSPVFPKSPINTQVSPKTVAHPPSESMSTTKWDTARWDKEFAEQSTEFRNNLLKDAPYLVPDNSIYQSQASTVRLNSNPTTKAKVSVSPEMSKTSPQATQPNTQNFNSAATQRLQPNGAPTINQPTVSQASTISATQPITSTPLTKVETLTAKMHGMEPQEFASLDPSTRQKLTQGLDPTLDPNSKNFQGKKQKNKQISNESKDKIKDAVENPQEQGSGMSIPIMAGLGIGGIFAGSAIANYVGGHDKSAEINYRGMTFDDYNKPKEAPPGDKHKMVVLVKSQNKTKLVRFGHRDYKHNYSDSAKNNYLTRSAGIRDKNGNLTKDDPFSPNYWSRKVLWPESKKADGKALGHS